MTNTLSGYIGTTDPGVQLGAEVWIDQTLIIDIPHVIEDTKFSCTLNDDEESHCLKIILKNKKSEHTILDEQGNILQDARLLVKDIAFDEFSLTQLFTDCAVYTHDFNGTQAEVNAKFYSEMGCNGTVSVEFTTPFYLWLLENM